jgi:predicted transcriptional regulator of viral defense system
MPMTKIEALKVLTQWDKSGKYIFTKQDLKKLFANQAPKTFEESLNRLVRSELLERVCRGIYALPDARSFDSYTIEHIAKALRRGYYNYVSLESILSEYGAISQIPVDRLTVMTTGRSGFYKTTYGAIEFIHTKRVVLDILNHTKNSAQRPLRIATKLAAWRDLKRVGRNTDMVHLEEIEDE